MSRRPLLVSWPGGVALEETDFDGEAEQLGAAPEAELVTQALAVGLHGLHAHGQVVGGLLVRVPLRQQAEHLGLPLAQHAGVSGSGRFAGAAPDLMASRLFPGTREIDEGAAVVDGADRRQQLDIGRLLDDVARRAGLERGLQVRRIVVHREHEHAGARRDPHQLFDRLREAGSGHGQIEQHDVGRRRLSTADRRGTVPDLAHHFHIGLRVDEQLEAGPEDRVVVGDEHPDGRHARYARRVGKWAVIVVPPPARDSTSALPRTSRRLTLRAPACLATLVSASCRTRYTVVCTSGGRISDSSPSIRTSTATPCRCANSCAWRVTAAGSPTSSRMLGWSPRESRPTSSRVWAAIPRSRCASSAASAMVRDSSIVRKPTSSAVSDCPASSWSSRAIRRRSSSWAVTACWISRLRRSSARSRSLMSVTTPITPMTSALP